MTTDARARRGTYSIVARDSSTGELGVAVQSHWFSVGPIVPWATPGVGAVATQANAEVSYGPELLRLLGEGRTATDALAILLAADHLSRERQVAVVDGQGAVAVHTGDRCMPFAGHLSGEQVSCQANLMGSEIVWVNMLAAYEGARGSLTDRLLDALDAGEAAGGDVRGRQSAAILVVPPAGRTWETVVSLRVEDDPRPLEELRRLVRLHDAYALAGRADKLIGERQFEEASDLYRQAVNRAPDNHELLFWSGLAAARVGRVEEGAAQVRAAIALQPGWGELLARLPGPPGSTVRARLTDA